MRELRIYQGTFDLFSVVSRSGGWTKWELYSSPATPFKPVEHTTHGREKGRSYFIGLQRIGTTCDGQSPTSVCTASKTLNHKSAS